MLRGHPRAPKARLPHPPPFAPSPPLGALAIRSVSALSLDCALERDTLLRRPRLGVGPPFPRLRVRGWRLSFPPPRSPRCFNTLAAVVAHHHRCWAGLALSGRDWLFAPCGRVALVGLLGPVCCRARHSARSCVALASLGTSVVASLPFFFGWRAVLRSCLFGVSPLAQACEVCPQKGKPE